MLDDDDDEDDDSSVGINVDGKFAYEDGVWIPTEGDLLFLTVAVGGIDRGWFFVLFRCLFLLLLVFCCCRCHFCRFVTIVVRS